MSEPTVPTPEMTAAAFSGPSYAITNFMVHPVTAGLLRVSFVETHPDGSNPQYRAAVVLDAEGAQNLGEVLLRYAAARAERGG